MHDRPKIFISSTSHTLLEYRALAREIVAAQGYEPVVQEHFETHTKELTDAIRSSVYRCQALIALVGPRYGFASRVDAGNGLTLSYTQYELLYALENRRPCLVLFYEGPMDAADPEPAELQRCQAHFIAWLRRRSDVNCTPFVSEATFLRVLAKHRWRRWIDGE